MNISRKHIPRKPWVTPGIAKSCHTKEKLYKCFIKDPTEINKNKYIKFRNRLKKLLTKSEQSYYRDKFELYKSNIKQTWQTIKHILNTNNSTPLNESFLIDNCRTNDKTIIARKFNEYFVNIGPSLANKIPNTNTNCTSYLRGNFKNSFTLLQTDVSEVISTVKG